MERRKQDVRRGSSQMQFSRKERKEGGGGGAEGMKKYGTLHEFACHPCAGAMLIFSVSFQF